MINRRLHFQQHFPLSLGCDNNQAQLTTRHTPKSFPVVAFNHPGPAEQKCSLLVKGARTPFVHGVQARDRRPHTPPTLPTSPLSP